MPKPTAICEHAEELIKKVVAERGAPEPGMLRQVASHSESPIEQLFAIAYAACIFDGCELEAMIRWNRGINMQKLLTPDRKSIPYSMFRVNRAEIVRPQCQVSGCRVDFAILRFSTFTDVEPPLVRSPLVVVECDGHDFHERTPEQAERDRSRDRTFQASGHVVFRFTGRELWRDALACAEQVDDFLNRYART